MVQIKEVVIQQTYTEAEVYIDVFVALIEKKQASSVLDTFCNDLPLQNYGLNHLKRIQPFSRTDKAGPLQIVVCPVKCYDEVPKHIKDICTELRTVSVCKLAPACREEFESWNKNWPINFHASQLEKDRERGLDSFEIAQAKTAHDRLLADQSKLGTFNIHHGGLVINPENGAVIATLSEALEVVRSRFPVSGETEGTAAADAVRFNSGIFSKLYTPTMLCIEGVAAAVRRGKHLFVFHFSLPFFLSNIVFFAYIDDPSLPENAYLCSGLDLYLTHEPDVMSSMALVHSRIRRVFFMHSDPVSGALQSGRGHIHSLRALNHHYRVFQFGADIDATAAT